MNYRDIAEISTMIENDERRVEIQRADPRNRAKEIAIMAYYDDGTILDSVEVVRDGVSITVSIRDMIMDYYIAPDLSVRAYLDDLDDVDMPDSDEDLQNYCDEWGKDQVRLRGIVASWDDDASFWLHGAESWEQAVLDQAMDEARDRFFSLPPMC